MEILIMVDALKRLVRNLLTWWCRITAMLVKTGKPEPRTTTVGSQYAWRLLSWSSVDNWFARAAQIQGFFDIPVDHLRVRL